MALNSSSNDSLLHEIFSSLSVYQCFLSTTNSFIITAFVFTSILLLLPLCIFILYHGLHQWRKKPSTSSAAAMSHSDVFTYHMVLMELVGISGCIVSSSGIFSNSLNVFFVGFCLFSFTWYGEMFFHVLTCVERYLAVVHPIIYLSLKNERGIRIRNIIIGCIWLLCFAATLLSIVDGAYIIENFLLMILSLTVVSFCSLSVLCALIRPGPGDQVGGRDRVKVNQSKLKAFYTIMVILGLLVLRFCFGLARSVVFMSGGDRDCVMKTCLIWIYLPSSLLLPLLYLHRTGKLVCWKNNIQKASGLNMQK